MSDPLTNELDLSLTPSQLASTVEALWDMVRDRLWRTLRPSPAWKSLNWQTVQDILDTSVAAYTKSMMLFRAAFGDRIDSDYMKYFQLSDAVWDALAEVTKATGWPSLKLHNDHNIDTCQLCTDLLVTRLS